MEMVLVFCGGLTHSTAAVGTEPEFASFENL